jgi:pseudoazurin
MKREFFRVTVAAALLSALFAGSVGAADHTVRMLNQGKDGPMVFEPAYLRVAVGDTVTFQPTEKGGHSSMSILTPAGAAGWKTALDQAATVKIDREGVFLYLCEPHKVMGMVGVIQAGKPVNLAAAKARAKTEQAAFAVGKDRFDKALAAVK